MNNGGYLEGGPVEVEARGRDVVLNRDLWEGLREAVAKTFELLNRDPKFRRVIRKRTAWGKKRADIETRQVARAYVLVNRAPSLIHNGKAWRR